MTTGAVVDKAKALLEGGHLVRRALMKCASPVLLLTLGCAGSCARCPRSRRRTGLPRHRPTGCDRRGKGWAGPRLGSVHQERAGRARAFGQGVVDVCIGRQGQLCRRRKNGSPAELHRPRHLPGNGARRQDDEYEQVSRRVGRGGVRRGGSSKPHVGVAPAFCRANGLTTGADPLSALSASSRPRTH
jgi:hypothetical protein